MRKRNHIYIQIQKKWWLEVRRARKKEKKKKNNNDTLTEAKKEKKIKRLTLPKPKKKVKSCWDFKWRRRICCRNACGLKENSSHLKKGQRGMKEHKKRSGTKRKWKRWVTTKINVRDNVCQLRKYITSKFKLERETKNPNKLLLTSLHPKSVVTIRPKKKEKKSGQVRKVVFLHKETPMTTSE